MKDLSSLPEDIYSVLEGKSLFDPSVVDRFGDTLKDILGKRLKRQEDQAPTLRMSSIGKPLRQLWYELNGVPGEAIEGKTLVKFAYGDLCEALIIALAEAAGHGVSSFQEEVELDGVPGHIDLVLDGVLVDVKSCSSYTFNKFKTGTLFESDPFGYVGQLAGYAEAMKLPAAWVAFDKVSGEICVLHLTQEQIHVFNARNRIAEIREAVSRPDEPERCYPAQPVSKTDKSGNLVLGVGCSYCSRKSHCWRDSNAGAGLKTYVYSTGPKFFVHVEKEPRVQQDSSWESFPSKDKKDN